MDDKYLVSISTKLSGKMKGNSAADRDRPFKPLYGTRNKKSCRRLTMLFVLALLWPLLSFAQTENIVEGTVTDAQGMPIPGVTVRVKNTQRGVATNFDGEYSIEAAPDEILVFSYVGMETQEIPVGDESTIDVVLKESAAALEEVVIVGYGVQKKASVVGAISQVSGEKLERVKMGGSVENTLQGNLPGLTVIMTDPTPGEESMGGYYAASPINMSIRGTSSMGSNAPLIIIDGVERPLSNMDPNNIASVSILKDASATAVYGVKGANGVVIITTKRGLSGALELEFNGEFSVKTPTMLPEYMNAYETMLLRNEAYRNDGNWDMIIPDAELEHYRTGDLPYLYPDFDWMEFYFKPGYDQQYNVNARGGNDFVQYFASVGYLTEGDVYNVGNIFPYEFDSQNAHYWHDRYNFRNNLDFNVTETTGLAVNLGGNIKVWNKPIDTFTQETWFESVTTMPYYPEEAVKEYPDGLIPYNQTGIRPFINPDQGEVRLNWHGGQGFQRFKANELLVDIKVDQDLDVLTEGLSFQALYSYNSQVRYQKIYNLPQYFGYYLDPDTQTWSRYDNFGGEDLNTPQPPLIVSNTENIWSAFRSHYYEGRFSYGRDFGNHSVGGTGVFSRRESRGISDFPHYEENWVGRATYDFKDKYFVEGTIAHSGSEKFAPGLRFGTFPSAAVGWMVSNENFYVNSGWDDVMNMLKLRYSYGVVGSDAGIARWLYLSEFTNSGGSVGFGYPLQYYPFISEGNIPVTDATWEEAIKQNIGVDMEFWQNAVSLSVDLFDERRVGMLQSRQSVPAWVGVGDIRGNLGETKSHGFEVALGWNKAVTEDLILFGNANLTWSENRVVFYDEPDAVPFHMKAEGKPVDIARRLGSYTPGTGIMDAGFYQDFDELFMYPVASGGNPIVGDFKFLDFNGDGVVDQQDRVVSRYPITPNMNWSVNVGANFHNWSFNAQFYGISNTQQPMRQGGMFFLYPFTQNKDNAFTAHANHWTPTNTNAQFPAVHSVATNQYNYQISQFSMVNGQYIRLRTARLGYRVEGDLLDRLKISEINLGLSGTNLWTWKKLDWGGDPEGFNFGADFGAYPQMKRFTFEVGINF